MKYFSIDRVFRNETLDNTHLAEFHQIEGVVADRGLSLGDLMGIINEFFNKLGGSGNTGIDYLNQNFYYITLCFSEANCFAILLPIYQLKISKDQLVLLV